jgi:hypothetical protein
MSWKCGSQDILGGFSTLIECSFVEPYAGQALASDHSRLINRVYSCGIHNVYGDRRSRAIQADFLSGMSVPH